MSKITLLLLFILVSCGKPITESEGKKKTFVNEIKGQSLLQKEMSLHFDLLPREGKVVLEDKFWSGHSWPGNQGSINYRWAKAEPSGFFYLSPTYREVSNMPIEKLAELSPAEKFDLYLGNYDYPLKKEVEKMSGAYMENWEGICHGWASATIHHPTPKAKMLKNPDGILIPFGVPDIKALLSFAYSKELIDEDETYGLRCENPYDTTEDRCFNDLPAHIFHAIITNKIGLLGQSIIMDIDPGQEVWNHPVLSYRSDIQKFQNKNTKKAVVTTELKYLDLIQESHWENSSVIQSRLTLKYEIILNEQGSMIDSKWISGVRPDFVWTIKKRNSFPRELNRIFDLLR